MWKKEIAPTFYTLYTITCLTNNKIYIGVCRWYKQRIGKHLYDLRRNKSGNTNLQVDYNKYGENDFVFDVVSKYDTKNEALLIEKYYTDVIFNMDKSISYNMIRGGSNVCSQIRKRYQDKLIANPELKIAISERLSKLNKGKKLSDETKDKIRKKHLGLKASDATREKFSKMRTGGNSSTAKKVIDTSNGKVYQCLKDAVTSGDFNINYDTLRQQVSGKNKNKTTLKWLL